ncbi:hypothetical protein Pcinc_004364 [Petrolisthes cinctipes]|uniref:Reverse transcriptase domain-containing protein n=1 Tax=Petrolisthes cinctipes TaxID=88211 RepID=A0AAE1GH17_PETCI|nr:hypothetical protein Pcinc_004364 [Petrolisthes cinctipes]
MVNVRLVYFLEQGDFLSPSQSGFRKHRSTIDALVRLEAAACEAFARHQHLVCVFFDLEKAYDTTWQYGILQQLHLYGLRGRLPRFLKEFLSDRSFPVRVGTTHSASVAQEEGVLLQLLVPSFQNMPSLTGTPSLCTLMGQSLMLELSFLTFAVAAGSLLSCQFLLLSSRPFYMPSK